MIELYLPARVGETHLIGTNNTEKTPDSINTDNSINRTDTVLPGTAVWEEILMGVEI